MGGRGAEKFTPETRELLIATSFLRSAPDRTDLRELNTADQRYGIAHRTLGNVSSSILGITVGCAKCHSHKYDPIPHTDYYRLLSIFTPAFNPQSWLQPEERRLPGVSAAEKKEVERHNEEIDKQAESFTKPLAELRRPYEERLLEEKLATIPDTLRDDARVAVQTHITAPPTISATVRSTTEWGSPIFTPPFFTSSASTTAGSPTNITDELKR